jgi:hypothetical protein
MSKRSSQQYIAKNKVISYFKGPVRAIYLYFFIMEKYKLSLEVMKSRFNFGNTFKL